MSELELYKFINENDVEIRWEEEELLLWMDHWDMETFGEILNREDADDGGYPCQLQTTLGQAIIVLDLVPLCEEEGINPENIFEKDKE